MNALKTTISIIPEKGNINHKKKGLAIGSCFVENIGGWLQNSKFDLNLNPYGIVYNPLSISNQLSALLDNQSIQPKLIKHDGLWHSFQHHGSFSGIDRDEVIAQMESHFSIAQKQLQQADYLILTFGTSIVYKSLENEEVVANCHKFPNNTFSKKRLSVKELMLSLSPVFEKLQTTLPQLKIILTVSPVRHLKDGFVENQRSKATLLLAVDNLTQQFDCVSYFPSYEIMMDDLRDYRFYNKDMLHPNELAVDYIKELFSETFFDDPTIQLQQEITSIRQAAAHRPLHPMSDGHQAFLKKQLERVDEFEMRFPHLNFDVERKAFFKV